MRVTHCVTFQPQKRRKFFVWVTHIENYPPENPFLLIRWFRSKFLINRKSSREKKVFSRLFTVGKHKFLWLHTQITFDVNSKFNFEHFFPPHYSSMSLSKKFYLIYIFLYTKLIFFPLFGFFLFLFFCCTPQRQRKQKSQPLLKIKYAKQKS